MWLRENKCWLFLFLAGRDICDWRDKCEEKWKLWGWHSTHQESSLKRRRIFIWLKYWRQAVKIAVKKVARTLLLDILSVLLMKRFTWCFVPCKRNSNFEHDRNVTKGLVILEDWVRMCGFIPLPTHAKLLAEDIWVRGRSHSTCKASLMCIQAYTAVCTQCNVFFILQ